MYAHRTQKGYHRKTWSRKSYAVATAPDRFGHGVQDLNLFAKRASGQHLGRSRE